MFSIFMLFTIFGQLVQQIMPHFVTQRALYEARERPSKTYSWKAFMLSNILVEIPWNSLMAVIIFFCLYYPIGLYNNAIPTDAVRLRGFQFFLFTSTFTNMMIAGIGDAETGGNMANLLFSLSLVFCGVLATPQSLPGFWIFMYRVSPFTYIVEGMLSIGLANQEITCAQNEYVKFLPPGDQTCAAYMEPYISQVGGYLQDPNATAECNYCTYSSTNVFLSAVSAKYSHVWRDYGILWAYIIFNGEFQQSCLSAFGVTLLTLSISVCGAVFFYWVFRVPKKPKNKKEKKV